MIAALSARLAPHGLNLVGVTPLSRYDEGLAPQHALARFAPGATSAIVIGNGGGALWAAFQAHRRAHPGHDASPDPLDAFTYAVIEDAARPLVGRSARLLYPFRFPADPVSFMRLAACAGLGHPSLTGVLVHPVFGPWIALRAALLVPELLDAPGPAAAFDPCSGCVERACITACPAGAVGPSGWDVPRCAGHRARSDDPCAARCHARFDCVVGREHRYPPDALAHHQAHARTPLLRFGAG